MPKTEASTDFIDDPEAVATLTTSRPAGHGAVRAYDWIGHHANQRPAKEAVRDLGTDRSFTYGELDRRIEAMACYLTSLGIGRGDRVAVLAHNGVEFFDVQFACARTGAICVLLNWRLTVTELEYILNDSSPALLVHVAELTESAEELCSSDLSAALGDVSTAMRSRHGSRLGSRSELGRSQWPE